MIGMSPVLSRAVALGLASLALTASIVPAYAGPNLQAGVALHYYGPTAHPHCAIPIPYGTSIRTQAYIHSPPWVYAYLLVCNGSTTAGVGKIECGLRYSGRYDENGGGYPVTIFSWTLCADAETPVGGWPGPGSGNTIFWGTTHCVRNPDDDGRPNTAIGIAGYFYLGAYAPVDSVYGISVTRHPGSGNVLVYDCAGNADILSPTQGTPHIGELGLGANVGWNPCFEFPVLARTVSWSTVKARHAQ